MTRALRLATALSLCVVAPGAARAAVTWPASQLLPSFPAPAPTQDLILIHSTTVSLTWEGEGPALSHATGHDDGDGWLCQTGVDAANKYMIFGPYDTTVPAGDSTARYRIKIDDNTADDALQVTLDVRDNARRDPDLAALRESGRLDAAFAS